MPRKIGSKEKLRRYLLPRVGKVLTSKELLEASGGATQWARRIRELRDEEGWPIRTHNDIASLKPGEYLLESIPALQDSAYSFQATISQRVRAQVLERNGYTCQMCGAKAGDPDDQNPERKVRLHLSHIQDKSLGGTNDPSNLRALCSACNQGAKNLTLEPPRYVWLLTQVRRAKEDDQRKVLDWLLQKFERKQKSP